ncbi:MAG TPA: DUF2142 domain-containing protein, partial [Conexibacter sp.]|nr:DUF2142 domain-containing protein [Conexibacter sp.]
LAAGLAQLLGHTAARRSGTDGVWVRGHASVRAGGTACQRRELLPARTAAVRIAGTTPAPALVVLRRNGLVLDRAVARPDARDQVLTAPIAPARRELADVEVCVRPRAAALLFGGPTPPRVGRLTIDGEAMQGSMAVSWLLPGRDSWWAFAPTLAARLDRGRGPWTAGRASGLLAMLLAASLALTALVVVRTLVRDRPLPRLALAVAAIATCNAAAWSLITPAFQVPDEVAHVAYVQHVGESGAPPPVPRAIEISPEQRMAMADAGYGSFTAPTLHAAAWSPFQQRRLVADLRRPLSRRARVTVGEGEPEPPLYYALEAIPYRAAHAATLLDRIALMRLLSACLAGLTAMLCVLFVRECLPGRPWAWAVGGLGVAFAPMLGFISGGVNPDAMLFALSAAVFVCVARAWRRGVTLRLALALGALLGVGLLTKVNCFGLVPGALLGLALAARRAEGAWNRRVAGRAAAALALAGGLFLLGGWVQAVALHRPVAVGRPASPESHVGLLEHAGYVAQVFLPRLPFLPATTLVRPGYQQLFETAAGVFGWVVVWLPRWAYDAAAAGLALVAVLAGRMLLAEPRELRWRARELTGYAVTAGAMLLLVGLAADVRRDILHIVQGRYLLPLLPLFALLLALGARGAGERWGRAWGVAIVAAAVAWSVAGQLVTIGFFYS